MARMGRRTSAHGQKSDNPTHEYKSFVFQLEDGSTFTTELDPMTYLLQYGAKTERGRIVGYEPPPGTHDPITGAVYAEIRRLVLGEILAHPAPNRDIHDFE